MKLQSLRAEMEACEQTQGLSVLAHGYSVNAYYHDLRSHVLDGTPLEYDWKLPEWVFDVIIWENQADLETINNYQIYHDCGKPRCLEIDDEGRRHFPNHAEVSANTWKELGGTDREVNLMRDDMCIHLLKDAGVSEFAKKEDWATLLITGLCEVHSNASMFGGVDSTSFKIKWKQINKRGKAILKQLEKNHD